ncbi:nucleotide disphospho-sugar-binding domain-containing protein [Polaromonas sp. YR568]|uniref:glycosyltransferase n=1 Tax=Polaromonas sp. YR568 TaxID=1855301 RepID=UPI003137FE8B
MRSNTVLFTWEIGQGFGHVMPLLPIARELKAQGHRVVFALRDVRGAGALLKNEGFTVLQAPAHPDQFFPTLGPQPQTMADILQVFGFTSKQSLLGLVAAWEGLFDLCKPDVVIASYAPLSLLCARRAAIPTILMALPFELPAAVHPCPPLRSGGPTPSGRVDDRIIQTINAVFSAGFVTSVHEIFRATKVFLMSFPELDAFAPRGNVEYCGNLFVTDVGRAPVWPEGGDSHRVFAYLNASLPNLTGLREKIHASPHAYCMVLRDADESLLHAWQAPNVSVVSEAVCLDQAFKDCDAVLSYGGAGFISASLLAGKPMVFYVRNLEPYLSAQQVAKLGAGVLPVPQSPSGVLAGLNKVLNDRSFVEAARVFACKHKSHHPQEVACKIVATVLQTVKS